MSYSKILSFVSSELEKSPSVPIAPSCAAVKGLSSGC